MQRPVIATPGAMTGIQPFPGFDPTISEDPDTLVDAAARLLGQARQANAAGRECVLRRYNWDSNLQRIERLLETVEKLSTEQVGQGAHGYQETVSCRDPAGTVRVESPGSDHDVEVDVQVEVLIPCVQD